MVRPIAASILACLLGAPAPATTFATATTKNLVDWSERVCCVRCEEAEPRRHRSGVVFTHVRLRLLENLKGRSDGVEIRLRVVGGRTRDAETRVPGMPRFEPGRECVVLLGKTNREGYPLVVAARRGVLDLERDEDGRLRLAGRVSGFPGLKGRTRVSLDDFRGAVKRAVRAQEERKEQEERKRERKAREEEERGRESGGAKKDDGR